MVNEVIMAVNEDLEPRQCRGRSNCQNGDECLSHALWADLSDMINTFLSEVSLQAIIDQRCAHRSIEFDRNAASA